MKDWNAIYEAQGVFQKAPSPRVLSAISHFRGKGLSRILDLGCGTGRHTTVLVDSGFEVHGCDSSEEALNLVSNLIGEADFCRCEMTSLPYRENAFDGIVCNHVIQHGLLADSRQASREMLRVIRPGGRLFLTVVSTEHPKYVTGREIEPNTKIDTDAVDGHIPHHFFTEDELKRLFEGCTIYSMEHFKGPSELDANKELAAWQMYAYKG
jgi:SAM-dependent methyltransferase